MRSADGDPQILAEVPYSSGFDENGVFAVGTDEPVDLFPGESLAFALDADRNVTSVVHMASDNLRERRVNELRRGGMTLLRARWHVFIHGVEAMNDSRRTRRRSMGDSFDKGLLWAAVTRDFRHAPIAHIGYVVGLLFMTLGDAPAWAYGVALTIMAYSAMPATPRSDADTEASKNG